MGILKDRHDTARAMGESLAEVKSAAASAGGAFALISTVAVAALLIAAVALLVGIAAVSRHAE